MGQRVGTRPTARRARALTWVCCVAAVGGVVLIAAWVATPWGSPIIAEQVEPEVASEPPRTVPPRSPSTAELPVKLPSTETPVSDLGAATTGLGPTTTTSTPTLSDLLPPIDRAAAVPEDRAPRASPVGISNTTFDTARYPIRAIGLEDDGQLEIPDETEIGWYRYGATAGQPGATVLAAHVSWNGTTGPFFELGRLDPGARITVTLDDGTTREYEVTERAKYDKNELPRERIWRNTGTESLVLITCGGDFNPEIRRYRHNIVIYAVPVG